VGGGSVLVWNTHVRRSIADNPSARSRYNCTLRRSQTYIHKAQYHSWTPRSPNSYLQLAQRSAAQVQVQLVHTHRGQKNAGQGAAWRRTRAPRPTAPPPPPPSLCRTVLRALIRATCFSQPASLQLQSASANLQRPARSAFRRGRDAPTHRRTDAPLNVRTFPSL
jgi:hypothetical protein